MCPAWLDWVKDIAASQDEIVDMVASRMHAAGKSAGEVGVE
jgi:hypothetical protein